MAFNLSKFVTILTSVAPVVLMLVPGGVALAPLVPILVKSIADAQASKKTGPEKRDYVVTMVENAANAANIVKPGTIDTPTIKEASGFAVDAVIGAVNAVAIAHASLPDEPAIVPTV